MKQTYQIFWIAALGVQATQSFAMNNANDTLSKTQQAIRYCHFAASTIAIVGPALHTEILPTTKTGLFACAIAGAAALNLSARLLNLFFNYHNEKSATIPRWKAYGCLIGSLAIPATIASGLYALAR